MIWDKIEKRSDKTTNINDWKEVYSFKMDMILHHLKMI